jgi:hypothetical protein
MFGLATNAGPNRRTLMFIQRESKQLSTAFANCVRKMMGSIFVLPSVSKDFIANVRLAIAVLELAAFFQGHKTSP